jgi:hypothetical protein
VDQPLLDGEFPCHRPIIGAVIKSQILGNAKHKAVVRAVIVVRNVTDIMQLSCLGKKI